MSSTVTAKEGIVSVEPEQGKRRQVLTSSLVIIDGTVLVIANHSPDADTDRGQERRDYSSVRVNQQPSEALDERRTSRSSDDVDVDIGTTSVASQPGGEDETQERHALVRSGEHPGLEGATRGREAG